MSRHVAALKKRALEDGARYYNVHKVNPNLKRRLWYSAIEDFRYLVNWAQFFVFYCESFEEGFENERERQDTLELGQLAIKTVLRGKKS